MTPLLEFRRFGPAFIVVDEGPAQILERVVDLEAIRRGAGEAPGAALAYLC